jgi:undecaprenyl-diphosphatase
VQLSKNYFHRLRPESLSFYYEFSFSFPSGHATVAVAFYCVLFYSIIRSRKTNASKFKWLIAGILFIGLLGFSRLYLCVHYLSDVMAGYSLGLLWMLLAISIREWMIHKRNNKKINKTTS